MLEKGTLYTVVENISWCGHYGKQYGTLRDWMGREVGGGFRMYTHAWFMTMYGKNHYNIVKQLASN